MVVETVAVWMLKKLEQKGEALAEADKAETRASTTRHLRPWTPGTVLSRSSGCAPGRAAARGMLRRAEATLTERIFAWWRRDGVVAQEQIRDESSACCCVMRVCVQYFLKGYLYGL